ncbi:MAG: DUF87 domain-containing protein [Nanoarchaeota archaeon]
MDTIEELFRKLRGLYGTKIEELWQLYILSDPEEKIELEQYIRHLYTNKLENTIKEKKILLPPRNNYAGEYFLGYVHYNNKDIAPFGIRENEWIQHTAIFGRSGSGKTNVAYNIITMLLHYKKPFLIFDWKKNYRDLLQQDFAFRSLQIYTIGNNLVPFHFNPLIPPPNIPPQIWLKKIVEIIAHAYFLGEGVIYLLHNLLDQLYKEFQVYNNPETYPTMHDLLAKLQELKLKGRQSLWYDSTLRALFELCFQEFGKVMNTQDNKAIETLLQKNVIFELDALTNTDKVFFIESLLLWIHHYRMQQKDRETFKHAIIIEEAHHILLKRKLDLEGKESIIDIILREIRELGEAIIIIDQHPSLIAPTALGNTYTTITMNLKHRNDVSLAGDAMLLPIENSEYIGQLPVGFGIVKMQGRQFEPFLVRFPLFQIEKGKITDEIVMKHMKRDIIIPTKKEQKILVRKETLSEEETAFLLDIYKHPLSGVVKRYTRLSISKRKGNDIKEKLENEYFIKTIDISTIRGRIKLFEITEKGWTILAQQGCKRKSTRKGGVEHQYWQYKVAQFFQYKGYNVKENYPLGNGKEIDIVVEKDTEKIAIEIETGKSDILANMEKCHGFDRIFCLVTEPQLKNKIEQQIKQYKNISVYFVKDFLKEQIEKK